VRSVRDWGRLARAQVTDSGSAFVWIGKERVVTKGGTRAGPQIGYQVAEACWFEAGREEGYKKENNKTIHFILQPSSDKGEPEPSPSLHLRRRQRTFLPNTLLL